MQPVEIKKALFAMANLAASQTMTYFRQPIAIQNKLDAGFDSVTLADREAERAIRNWLETHYPAHGIIGEEEGEKNARAQYCWVIDPVDGTRAFIAGLPVWGTLIGLYQNGVPLAGIMHQPFIDERFWSDGEGAYLQQGNGAQTPLAASSTVRLDEAIVMTTAPELFDKKTNPKWQALSASCRLLRYGFDCYAYAMLAAGHVDIVVDSGLKLYDIAALIPIIENAGGIITDWQGGSAAEGGDIIAAANPALHQAALLKLALA